MFLNAWDATFPIFLREKSGSPEMAFRNPDLYNPPSNAAKPMQSSWYNTAAIIYKTFSVYFSEMIA